ncbi:uncharacterized protein THITE_160290 [Thermothielavioides terrestris NRRL 8126]|uniref:HNH domain-containing protein n=1 Tax=Thermothielavioides terrestris (strain ATCC 38088 / NRRL 8126) TaxID=578455 RepID=G2R7Z9_THETT|nr:uncharacterized protein THITE_160290 [Thermothielavioides terrestris NRRL 8126]AEO68058.1 hypothetical protein THITE_160290 [Thermothielavioides terrestris NRRL 8126]
MADEIPEEYIANYEQFRDILSSFLIERIAAPLSKPKPKPKRRSKKPSSGPTKSQADNAEAEPSADDLAEFTSYIATAVFLALPPDLQSLTHHAWADNPSLQALYTPLPLSAERTAALLQTLDPSIADSLAAYGLTSPPSPSPSSSPLTPSSHSTLLALSLPSTAEFLAPVLTAYLTATTTPPPPPCSTRAQVTACELCARAWVPLTYHHLVPRMVHEKAVRRGWHRAGDLQNVAWLCAACHRFVHRFRGHEELAREFYTVERLLAAEEVQRFVGWVGRVRWKKR